MVFCWFVGSWCFRIEILCVMWFRNGMVKLIFGFRIECRWLKCLMMNFLDCGMICMVELMVRKMMMVRMIRVMFWVKRFVSLGGMGVFYLVVMVGL